MIFKCVDLKVVGKTRCRHGWVSQWMNERTTCYIICHQRAFSSDRIYNSKKLNSFYFHWQFLLQLVLTQNCHDLKHSRANVPAANWTCGKVWDEQSMQVCALAWKVHNVFPPQKDYMREAWNSQWSDTEPVLWTGICICLQLCRLSSNSLVKPRRFVMWVKFKFLTQGFPF